MPKFLFWFSFLLLLYTYAGYGILVFLVLRLRGVFRFRPKAYSLSGNEPEVTLLIAAYNEEAFIGEKIQNSLELDYPHDRLRILIITDGSDDETVNIVRRFPSIQLLHHPERRGKVAALNRAVPFVSSPYIIFSDANTLLNKECIRKIMGHYEDPKTGGVAGEKKILADALQQIAGAGEGLYWKYESFLKKLDSELYTVVGAAGELFSMRSSLFQPLPEDTIIEDFIQSLLICERGYVIRYEPMAYAVETASASMNDEQKRKVRIAAGAFQAMGRLGSLFNFFRHPVLSFQFLSHRILRWTMGPICLILLLLSNAWLVLTSDNLFYRLAFLLQLGFYALGITGWMLADRNLRLKIFYVPYYFLFMNLSVFQGFSRFLSGKQGSVWEKAARLPRPEG